MSILEVGMRAKGRLVQHHQLADKLRVFRDHVHAGEVLDEMLEEHRGTDALVLGIPAGGASCLQEDREQLYSGESSTRPSSCTSKCNPLPMGKGLVAPVLEGFVTTIVSVRR